MYRGTLKQQFKKENKRTNFIEQQHECAFISKTLFYMAAIVYFKKYNIHSKEKALLLIVCVEDLTFDAPVHAEMSVQILLLHH